MIYSLLSFPAAAKAATRMPKAGAHLIIWLLQSGSSAPNDSPTSLRAAQPILLDLEAG